MNAFNENLKIGQMTEGLISRWLMARCNAAIMPAYEKEMDTGKGPQVFTKERDFVSPDMLVFSEKGIKWIESKHKTVFSWHRITKRWVTGIDLRHYTDYLRVAKETKLPVWLLFYHESSTPADKDIAYGCPGACPVGLYGGDLFDLVAKENHRTEPFNPNRAGMKGHGRTGMVYWSVDALKLIATKEDVEFYASRKVMT